MVVTCSNAPVMLSALSVSDKRADEMPALASYAAAGFIYMRLHVLPHLASTLHSRACRRTTHKQHPVHTSPSYNTLKLGTMIHKISALVFKPQHVA